MSTGIGGEHAYLAILDTSGGAPIPVLHDGRASALLQKTDFVRHEHAVFIAQCLGNVIDQIITRPGAIPPCPVQQMLHPVG
ncbi:hypothetical protein TSA66_00305 [Noviherbaspirillum autotrophicum]|uniref:Uncharacterized protein n=1 Tax=Noviherbaspirillum autotrophicum TaxID=709839 RepID=A0A0C1Y752_9BURK|nr:hypothetical protein TSA66_21035 [Noviherbaspirillum autotrophicum]KIF84198.1 hypothetical protein TSA66_00305 [Noviherbaspirillum autotrophicum]